MRKSTHVVDASVDSRIPNEEIVRDGAVRAGCVGVNTTTVLELAACVRLHWLEDGVVDDLNACRKRPAFSLNFLLCFSRACLGKCSLLKMVRKRNQKRRFLAEVYLACRSPCPCDKRLLFSAVLYVCPEFVLVK
eukprot:COSAG06_NODE_3591_length_5143_cov_3.495440_3_plen_134_part_00